MRTLFGSIIVLLSLIVIDDAWSADERFALVIGNARYSAARAPLKTPVRNAREMSAELRRLGFDVTAGENLDARSMQALLDKYYRKIKPGSTALIFYSGHGIRVGWKNFVIPVDANIRSERDVLVKGVGVDTILEQLHRKQARAKVFVVDASRPNPFEPRFRSSPGGLAPAKALDGSLLVFSTAPLDLLTDSGSRLFVTALLSELRDPKRSVVQVFAGTQTAVYRSSKGQQEPWIANRGVPDSLSFGGRDVANTNDPLVIDMRGGASLIDAIKRIQSEPKPSKRTGDIAIESILEALRRRPLTRAISASSSPPEPAIERFPTIEAPEHAAIGQKVTVLVSLTVDQATPDVALKSAGGDASVSPKGALRLPMLPDRQKAPISVVLYAPGFDFDANSSNGQTIELDRAGDSAPASFTLIPRKEGRQALRVSFFRDGQFLASATKSIDVDGTTQRVVGQTRSLTPIKADTARAITIESFPRPIDMTVEIVYDNPDALGKGTVTIASPHFSRGTRQGTVDTSLELTRWIENQVRQFRRVNARGGRAADDSEQTTGQQREEALRQLRAFGSELYRRAAPQVLKDSIKTLVDEGKLRTIQIYSNNPFIPWELMRASRTNGVESDFFGIAFAIARWHEDDDGRPSVRPVAQQHIDEVVTIAPSYVGAAALAAQSDEIAQIEFLMKSRRLVGQKDELARLLTNPPTGVVHFAGHGEVRGSTPTDRRFQLNLEDGIFDIADWRGSPRPAKGKQGGLFFFNACDVGQAESVAGAVDGWAPAVLARGASGYIGGLWPLRDGPAGRFAEAFYRSIAAQLERYNRASVTFALSEARRLVYVDGDPTFLGYAYYGDAELHLVR
jgi:hypothetical protein